MTNLDRVFPETTAAPCNECPWRRDAIPGYLGPYTPLDWVKIAHGEQPIACHKTIRVHNPLESTGSWDDPKIRQCRGAAIFRENVGKSPKNPTIITGPHDPVAVFDDTLDFCRYHGDDEVTTPIDLYSPLSTGGH